MARIFMIKTLNWNCYKEKVSIIGFEAKEAHKVKILEIVESRSSLLSYRVLPVMKKRKRLDFLQFLPKKQLKRRYYTDVGTRSISTDGISTVDSKNLSSGKP